MGSLLFHFDIGIECRYFRGRLIFHSSISLVAMMYDHYNECALMYYLFLWSCIHLRWRHIDQVKRPSNGGNGDVLKNRNVRIITQHATYLVYVDLTHQDNLLTFQLWIVCCSKYSRIVCMYFECLFASHTKANCTAKFRMPVQFFS